MNLEAARVTTTIGGVAAIISASPRAAAAQGFDRTLPWLGQDHAAKRKNRHAGERQRQNSKMQPSGRGHLALLQRPGHQFDSAERM